MTVHKAESATRSAEWTSDFPCRRDSISGSNPRQWNCAVGGLREKKPGFEEPSWTAMHASGLSLRSSNSLTMSFPAPEWKWPYYCQSHRFPSLYVTLGEGHKPVRRRRHVESIVCHAGTVPIVSTHQKNLAGFSSRVRRHCRALIRTELRCCPAASGRFPLTDAARQLQMRLIFVQIGAVAGIVYQPRK